MINRQLLWITSGFYVLLLISTSSENCGLISKAECPQSVLVKLMKNITKISWHSSPFKSLNIKLLPYWWVCPFKLASVWWTPHLDYKTKLPDLICVIHCPCCWLESTGISGCLCSFWSLSLVFGFVLGCNSGKKMLLWTPHGTFLEENGKMKSFQKPCGFNLSYTFHQMQNYSVS